MITDQLGLVPSRTAAQDTAACINDGPRSLSSSTTPHQTHIAFLTASRSSGACVWGTLQREVAELGMSKQPPPGINVRFKPDNCIVR